jgi:hypothetical protein
MKTLKHVNEPIVLDGVLIYERRRFLEIIFTETTPTTMTTITKQIPWHVLIESAKRCQPEKFQK